MQRLVIGPVDAMVHACARPTEILLTAGEPLPVRGVLTFKSREQLEERKVCGYESAREVDGDQQNSSNDLKVAEAACLSQGLISVDRLVLICALLAAELLGLLVSFSLRKHIGDIDGRRRFAR